MTNSRPATSRVSCISMPARRRRASASACIWTTATRIASTHRGHGHCIAKGCDEQGMMAGDLRQEGRPVRRQGRLDAHRRPVQGHAGRQRHRRRRPAADLRRRADRQDLKTGGVAIAFVGDGGSNQGTTFESYNLAKVWNLPAIFVVEDNGYAESTALEMVGRRQPGRARQRLRHAVDAKSTGPTSSPSTRPRAR